MVSNERLSSPSSLSEWLPFGTSFVGDAADDRYDQNSKSLAFFTNNTWHATDALMALHPAAEMQKEKVEGWIVADRPDGELVPLTLAASPAQGSAEGRSYRCQAAMRSCLRSLYTSRAMNRFRHRSTSFLESPSASLRCM